MRPTHLSLIFVALLLSACIGQLKADLTTYHTLSPGDLQKSVEIRPGSKELEGSLEFAAFKAKLAQRLAENGFEIAAPGAPSDYVAFFVYNIDSGTTTTHTGSVPMYGQTGGGTTYQSGTVSAYGTGGYGYGTYSGSSYTAPTYGIVGSQVYSYDLTTYTRVLLLDMYETAALAQPEKASKVLEMKLVSSGHCGKMAPLMDELLEAAFKDFPGTSGESKEVVVTGSGKC